MIKLEKTNETQKKKKISKLQNRSRPIQMSTLKFDVYTKSL